MVKKQSSWDAKKAARKIRNELILDRILEILVLFMQYFLSLTLIGTFMVWMISNMIDSIPNLTLFQSIKVVVNFILSLRLW